MEPVKAVIMEPVKAVVMSFYTIEPVKAVIMEPVKAVVMSSYMYLYYTDILLFMIHYAILPILWPNINFVRW